MNWLKYNNQGAIRSQPLSDRLIGALSFLPEMGVQMEVFSGGQHGKGSGHPRVGSTRHDHGNAADVFFYKDGRRLDWADLNDRPLFEQIVQRAKVNGVTGFGAGPGYMRPGSMHIGFGKPAVWGADGKGANAPDWLQAAYGVPISGGSGDAILTGSEGNNSMITAPPSEQSQQGFLGQFLSPKAHKFFNPERVAKLQMALEGMTQNPNQGIIANAQSTLDTSAKAKSRNQTAEWLANRGHADLAQGVASGAVDAQMAMQIALTPTRDPAEDVIVINGQLVNKRTSKIVGDYRSPNEPPVATALERQYELAKLQGYTGTFLEYQKEIRKSGAPNITNNLAPILPGEEMFDKEVAKELAQFSTSGAADAAKNLAQLKEVRHRIASGDAGNVSGPFVGSLPDGIAAIANPNAIDVREQVEEVVQRNLREILGGQFAQKEGEQLIRRAYNPLLGEEANLARLDRLIRQVELAYEQKASAANYFSRHGTLKGWDGKLPSMADFAIFGEEDVQPAAPIPSEFQKYLEAN